MTKKCFIIGVLVGLLCYSILGRNTDFGTSLIAFKQIYLGQIQKDDYYLVYHNQSYPLYRLMNTAYIPLEYFRFLGARVTKSEGRTKIDYENTPLEEGINDTYFNAAAAYMSSEIFYVGSLRTYVVEADGYYFVPIDTLAMFFKVSAYHNAYVLEDLLDNLNRYTAIDKDFITNKSGHTLRISVLDVYWDGKKYQQQCEKNILLEPYQKLERKPVVSDEKLIYITTVLLSINDFRIGFDSRSCYGQKNIELFKKYSSELKRERLSKLFPSYLIIGTLKYDMGAFKKGDQVEIWRAENRLYYEVKTPQGKTMMLPSYCLTVESDKGIYYQKVTEEDIEEYATLKELTSQTDYLIWSDIYRQRTYILKKAREGWELQKIFICSSGRNTHPTPRGLFKLEYTLPYFGVEKNYRCKNAVVFYRDYMFHSILFDSTGKYIKAGKYQLGYRVSHGCVRLSEEDSAWIYKHIPLGTAVWIE